MKVIKYIIVVIIAIGCFIEIVDANIMCSDGTTSPSCTSCTKGCCSHHGGCASSSKTTKKKKAKKKKNSSGSKKTNTNNNKNNDVFEVTKKINENKEEDESEVSPIVVTMVLLGLAGSAIHSKNKKKNKSKYY